MICPNCGKDTLSPNQGCACANCSVNFVKVGESVYVREDALQKAAKIVEEIDARLTRIVQEKVMDDLTGSEGEVAGVVSGSRSGTTVIINDFLVTGTPGWNGYYSVEPILALDYDQEESKLLSVIRRLYKERKIEVPILLLLPIEVETIRKEAGMGEKDFTQELKRLIEAGQERKVGTFHSHESAGSDPSGQDIRIIKLKDLFAGDAFGKNDIIEVILSEHLIVLEKGSAREIGRIALANTAPNDHEYYE